MAELLVAWVFLGSGVYVMYASWRDAPPWKALIAKAKDPNSPLITNKGNGSSGGIGDAAGSIFTNPTVIDWANRANNGTGEPVPPASDERRASAVRGADGIAR